MQSRGAESHSPRCAPPSSATRECGGDSDESEARTPHRMGLLIAGQVVQLSVVPCRVGCMRSCPQDDLEKLEWHDKLTSTMYCSRSYPIGYCAAAQGYSQATQLHRT